MTKNNETIIENLWQELVNLPSVAITYKDDQEILWIMLRKEDYKDAIQKCLKEHQ